MCVCVFFFNGIKTSWTYAYRKRISKLDIHVRTPNDIDLYIFKRVK